MNGYPGSGKDTFMELAAEKFRCYQHSTIDVCKEVAETLGWDGEKDDHNRAMLVDLKKWYIKYFDGVFRDFIHEVNWADEGTSLEYDFFFTASRESAEIERIRDWCSSNGYKCVYIFMDRNTERDYGNESDNNVMNGAIPNVYFNNKEDMVNLQERAIDLLSDILSDKDDLFG